jgi:hypothetical protein
MNVRDTQMDTEPIRFIAREVVLVAAFQTREIMLQLFCLTE